MELMTMFVVFALVGGAGVAYWIARLNRGAPRPQASTVTPRQARLDTDMINMAHIRVAGVGGFGLVVMAIAVALYIPSIGVSIGTGLVFGALFALWLIARRKRLGPMPSSGRRPGANIVLAIDETEPTAADQATSPESSRPMDLLELRTHNFEA